MGGWGRVGRAAQPADPAPGHRHVANGGGTRRTRGGGDGPAAVGGRWRGDERRGRGTRPAPAAGGVLAMANPPRVVAVTGGCRFVGGGTGGREWGGAGCGRAACRQDPSAFAVAANWGDTQGGGGGGWEGPVRPWGGGVGRVCGGVASGPSRRSTRRGGGQTGGWPVGREGGDGAPVGTTPPRRKGGRHRLRGVRRGVKGGPDDGGASPQTNCPSRPARYSRRCNRAAWSLPPPLSHSPSANGGAGAACPP